MALLGVSPSVPTIEWRRTQIDGLPAYVIDSGRDVVGGIVFRVGRADESLPTAGLTNLVRQLVIGFDDNRLPLRSEVSGSTTSFFFDESIEDLSEVLTELGRRIANPDLHRLDEARDLVRAEFQGRDLDEVGVITKARFGPRGYGLTSYECYGLDRITEEDITDWCDRFFTAANCAIWIDGEQPFGIELNLPEGGERRPMSKAAGLPHGFPAWVDSKNGRVMLSLQTLDTPDLHLGVEVLTRRVHEFMRERAALTLGSTVRVDPIDGSTSHFLIGLDIVGSRAPEALSTFVGLVNRLADTRPDIREVDEARVIVAERMATPAWFRTQVERAAMLELQGVAPPPVSVLRERLDRTDAKLVHTTFRAALDTAIYHLPTGVEMPNSDASHIPKPSRVAVEGQVFEAAVERRHGHKLILSVKGITIVEDGNTLFTSMASSCAGLLKWADGGRELVDATGVNVRIDPAEWVDGRSAIETIDKIIPERRHIDNGRRLGLPEIDPDRRKVPTRFARFQWLLMIAMPIVVLAGFRIALSSTGTTALIGGFVGAVVATAALALWARRMWRETGPGGKLSRPEIYVAAIDDYLDPRAVATARDYQYFAGGTLLAWLVNRGLVSASFRATSSRDIGQIRSRSNSGPEVFQHWNGLLVSDMVNAEANEFLFDYLRLEPIVRASVDGKSGYAFNFAADFAALGNQPPTSGDYNANHAWSVYDRMADRLDDQFAYWSKHRRFMRVKRVVASPPRFL